MASFSDIDSLVFIQQVQPTAQANRAFEAVTGEVVDVEVAASALKYVQQVGAQSASHAAAYAGAGWVRNIKANETATGVKIGPWNSTEALRVEMRELRSINDAEFKSLRDKIDRLASAVSRLSAVDAVAVELPELVRAALLASSIQDLNLISPHSEDLAELFNSVADSEIGSSVILDAAAQSLKSKDPAVRSSASRALAVLAGRDAVGALEEILKHETNAGVRSIVNGALEVARL